MMKFLQNLFLTLASFAFVFALGEVALRLQGFPAAIYDYDADTGLGVLIPDNDFVYAKSCLKNRVTTNSLGFHDAEFAAAKAPDAFRVAVVGDSFVQALEVPLQGNFASLLERSLNARAGTGKKAQVYAFGRSGNGSALNFLYLRHFVKKFRPDLVLHAFYPLNDLRDDSRELTETYVRQTGDGEVFAGKVYPDSGGEIAAAALDAALAGQKAERKPRPWYVRLARASAFAAWLKDRVRTARANLAGNAAQNPATAAEGIPVDHEVFLRDEPEAVSRAWAAQEKLIALMRDEAASWGAKYALFSVADAFRVHGEYEKAPYWDPARFDAERPEKRLGAIAAGLGVPYLPLLPAFKARRERTGRDIAFPCDGHWNATGHAWAGEELLSFVADLM